jgi:hypothetical protein
MIDLLVSSWRSNLNILGEQIQKIQYVNAQGEKNCGLGNDQGQLIRDGGSFFFVLICI